MAIAYATPLSAEEFEKCYLGKPYELLRGEVIPRMPAGGKHGKITATLTVALGQAVIANKLADLFAAETGFIVRTPTGESVLAPDLALIRKERIPPQGYPAGFCPVVPDLVVEVVSPSDTYATVRAKVADWLAGGVQVVWVVDPQRRVVEIWHSPEQLITLTENDTLTGEPILPSFSIPLKTLFE